MTRRRAAAAGPASSNWVNWANWGQPGPGRRGGKGLQIFPRAASGSASLQGHYPGQLTPREPQPKPPWRPLGCAALQGGQPPRGAILADKVKWVREFGVCH